MATSGNFATTNTYIKYRTIVTVNSQSIEGNYSNVTVTMDVWRTNSGYTTYGTGTAYCTIMGTQYTHGITSNDKFTYNSHTEVFSWNGNIGHNADGTLTITTAATISHSQFDSTTGGGFDVAAPTIPRATTPTLSTASVVMGVGININCTPAAGGFVHNLWYNWSDLHVLIATTGAGTTNTAWTFPVASGAPKIPNDPLGSGNIQCDTYAYSGGPYIGTKYVGFTGYVPNDVTTQPMATGTVNTGINLLNHAASGNIYVQGKSSTSITTNSYLTRYGSSLESWTYYYGAQSKTVNTSTNTTITSDILQATGTQNLSLAIKDSRDISAFATITNIGSIYVHPYSVPTIASFNAQRSTAGGVVDETNGTYLKATAQFTVAPVTNLTSRIYKFEYRKRGDVTFLFGASGNIPAGTISATGIINPGAGSLDNSYEIRATVQDDYTSGSPITSLNASVPSAFVLMDFYNDGTGLAIGTVAEHPGVLDIKLPTNIINFTGMIAPFFTLAAPSGWLLCYGQEVSQATYPELYSAIVARKGVCSFSNGGGGATTITLAGHNLYTGDPIHFIPEGYVLPTGFASGTQYYARYITADTFQISTLWGGAWAGTSLVTTTTTGQGVLYHAPAGKATDPVANFKIPDFRGRMPLGRDNMGGTAATRVNNVDANGQSGHALSIGIGWGEDEHVLSAGELPIHNHILDSRIMGSNVTDGPTNTGYSRYAPTTDYAESTTLGQTAQIASNTGNVGSGYSHNNMPPYVTINYCIKT